MSKQENPEAPKLTDDEAFDHAKTITAELGKSPKAKRSAILAMSLHLEDLPAAQSVAALQVAFNDADRLAVLDLVRARMNPAMPLRGPR